MPYNRDGVGYQNVDTSKTAADQVKAKPMREQVTQVLKDHWPYGMTAQEVAKAIGRDTFYGVQPRLSELKNEGIIRDSGDRAPLPTGKLGIVWQWNCTPVTIPE